MDDHFNGCCGDFDFDFWQYDVEGPFNVPVPVTWDTAEPPSVWYYVGLIDIGNDIDRTSKNSYHSNMTVERRFLGAETVQVFCFYLLIYNLFKNLFWCI